MIRTIRSMAEAVYAAAAEAWAPLLIAVGAFGLVAIR